MRSKYNALAFARTFTPNASPEAIARFEDLSAEPWEQHVITLELRIAAAAEHPHPEAKAWAVAVLTAARDATQARIDEHLALAPEREAAREALLKAIAVRDSAKEHAHAITLAGTASDDTILSAESRVTLATSAVGAAVEAFRAAIVRTQLTSLDRFRPSLANAMRQAEREGVSRAIAELACTNSTGPSRFRFMHDDAPAELYAFELAEEKAALEYIADPDVPLLTADRQERARELFSHRLQKINAKYRLWDARAEAQREHEREAEAQRERQAQREALLRAANDARLQSEARAKAEQIAKLRAELAELEG